MTGNLLIGGGALVFIVFGIGFCILLVIAALGDGRQK